MRPDDEQCRYTPGRSRDSLFLLAQLRVDEQSERAPGEGAQPVRRRHDGRRQVRVIAVHWCEVELRNIGRVEGTVAWMQDNRFGIAFVEEIDPKLARGADYRSRHRAPQSGRTGGASVPTRRSAAKSDRGVKRR